VGVVTFNDITQGPCAPCAPGGFGAACNPRSAKRVLPGDRHRRSPGAGPQGSGRKRSTTRIAYCWRHGQSITDAGITNDIWVKGSLEDGGRRYMSAVYLVGDERGGLPVEAVCTN